MPFVSQATVAGVVRLVEAVSTVSGTRAFADVVLPQLAELVACDAVALVEDDDGTVRRIDHVVGAPPPTGVRHRLAVGLDIPPPGDVTIMLDRVGRGFLHTERELLRVLCGPLSAGYLRATGGTAPLPGSSPYDARLTDREQQVLHQVARGRTNVAIAHSLGISPRTVGKHLEHAYRKLEVSSRAAAVATFR
jgi:DNA-binding CsgD family transcriptional regulator